MGVPPRSGLPSKPNPDGTTGLLFNLLFLGVVGIYVGEVFIQTKHRPHFLVRARTPNAPD